MKCTRMLTTTMKSILIFSFLAIRYFSFYQVSEVHLETVVRMDSLDLLDDLESRVNLVQVDHLDNPDLVVSLEPEDRLESGDLLDLLDKLVSEMA